MAEYRDLLRVSKPGVPEIVALSVDTPERSAQLRRELELPFRLLCDPEKKVVDAWGLLNKDEKGGISFNATFGLDRKRRVVFRSLDKMVSRASGEQAIQAVMHPPPEPSKEAPPRRKVLPSLIQFAKAAWYALRHGMGAPRGR